MTVAAIILSCASVYLLHPPGSTKAEMLNHTEGNEQMIASLSPILSTSWTTTAGCSALLGLSLHQVIRNLEIDNRGWEMVFTYLGALLLLFVGFVAKLSLSITSALLHTCLASGVFLASLYGSILVYRAFFHRLNHFPGPFAARLSNLYQ
jgi:hypothetical protein